jgi:arylsulfate sulfotransferase
MKTTKTSVWYIAGLLALCAPGHASVSILSVQPSLSGPQPIGSSIIGTVIATDSNSGPLTFQFNVAPPAGSLSMAWDFNAGTFNSSNWTSQPFTWTPTLAEGSYQIQVVAKDFTSGETASHTAYYQVSPLVSGSTPVVVPTANPLVALFSAPSCAAGSSMRVWFQQQSVSGSGTATNWLTCHPPATMTFEVAGMLPTTTYNMYAQTLTAGQVQNGPTLSFTTGALPTTIPFPGFRIAVPPGAIDTADPVVLISPIQFETRTVFPAVASKLSGQIVWYYYANTVNHSELLTRPLSGGSFLSIQDVPAWNPATIQKQVLREVDLAGNVIRETNTGVLQQQLLAMGATNAAPCNSFPSPPPVGAACLGAFHHDAIQTLPNGQTAVLVDVEKIFPPGTQGDTSGLPVDVVGDMIIVLNSSWQVAWYFDAFEHDGGDGQLDINRPAVLGETCGGSTPGCPPMFLLGPGIAPLAQDWLHANSLYYQPQDGSIIWSSRHQDWAIKIDYNNGLGTGNVIWLMGQDGAFTFNNIYNDPWPWFSHQHEVGVQNGGLGPMTIFDNGNTRVSPPPLGLGSGDSRGMSLTVNETPCPATPCMQVTPVLSVDLGVYSTAMGSAQLLSNNNYFFLAAAVHLPSGAVGSYSIEILPTAGTDTGSQVYNLQGTEAYRAWRMPNLYQPPTI